MSVPKKSLISNRVAVKKAIIASAPTQGTESKETGSLKASGLTALSMKKKKGVNAFKHTVLKPATAFKSTMWKKAK